jgi:hypothetical protein
MFYPNAPRMNVVDAKPFFVKKLKPKLPMDRAMKNTGRDSVFRHPLTVQGRAQLAVNLQRTLLLSN